MTIEQYVKSKTNAGINQWIDWIKNDKLEGQQKIIIACAEHFDMIEINHNANFENCIRF